MGEICASKDIERSKQSLFHRFGGLPCPPSSSLDEVHLAKAFHIRLLFKVIIHIMSVKLLFIENLTHCGATATTYNHGNLSP